MNPYGRGWSLFSISVNEKELRRDTGIRSIVPINEKSTFYKKATL